MLYAEELGPKYQSLGQIAVYANGAMLKSMQKKEAGNSFCSDGEVCSSGGECCYVCGRVRVAQDKISISPTRPCFPNLALPKCQTLYEKI